MKTEHLATAALVTGTILLGADPSDAFVTPVPSAILGLALIGAGLAFGAKQ